MRSPTVPTAPARHPHSRQQGGFALVVGLLLLLVLTILGVSAMRGTTLQERMAGNMQDRAIAFQAAEAALRAGESKLDQNTLPAFGSTGPYYVTDSTAITTPRWQSIYGLGAAAPSSGSVVDCTEKDSGCSSIDATSASFFIEKLQDVVLPGNSLGPTTGASTHAYRVTAEGAGLNQGTAVVLQSTVIR